MKNRRLLSLLAAAALLLLVAGCGKNAGDPKDPQTTPSQTASGEATSSTTTEGSTAPSNNQSNNQSSTQTGTTAPATAEQPKPAGKASVGPLAAGETAKLGPLSITLKQIGVVDKAAGLPPGYIHLMTEIVVLNEGAEPYTINITDHFKLETPEGKKAPYNVQATANRSPRLQGTAEKGQTIEGWIGYLSKKVAGKYKYQFIHPDYGDITWEFAVQ